MTVAFVTTLDDDGDGDDVGDEQGLVDADAVEIELQMFSLVSSEPLGLSVAAAEDVRPAVPK